MATVVIRRPGPGQGPGHPTPPVAKHPKATLIAEGGVKLVLPFAPVGANHGGFTRTTARLDRPGRKPLGVDTGPGLRSCSFTVFLGYRDHQRSVEPLLNNHRGLAGSGDRITIAGLGGLEGGHKWRLDDMTVEALLRQQGTNAITRANVTLAFIEDVDGVVNVGPLSGGKKGGGVGFAQVGGRGNRARHYTTQAGDTLARIALKFYGDPSKWRLIAHRNKINNPRKLKAGTRLIIPPED